MPQLIQSTLKERFGFDAFRPGQREAISYVLDGQDTLVVMPTGSGKSLCYQLPALLFEGITLVISPLIALMKDQVDMLHKQGIAATFINSSLSLDELTERQADVRAGRYKLVYVSPERLRNNAFLRTLAEVDVSLLAVDEAHCISQWGYDFRPDYLHIRDLLDQIKRPCLMALTATATPEVQNDVLRQLNMPQAKRIVTGFDRVNLEFQVEYAINEKKKLELLQKFLKSCDFSHSGIIYVGTRRQAEFLHEFVGDMFGSLTDAKGFRLKMSSCFYHAGLDDDVRKRTQELFLTGQVPIMIATNAFGMGIDKSDVRFVVHYDLPSTIERYYQEAGRAGRDGEQAQALLIYCPEDRALQEWFIENDSPSEDELRLMFQVIVDRQNQEWTAIRYDELARLTGVHPAKLKVGVDQLEQAGGLIRFPDTGGRVNLQIIERDASSLNLADLLKLNRLRRKRKLQELEEMVNYAEGDGCRRKALLSHFGDVKSEQAYVYCCDNCEITDQPSTLSTGGTHDAVSVLGNQVAHQILQCVTELNQPLGRTKLSQVLRGSQAKGVTEYGHHQIQSYGVLNSFVGKKILETIDWLIEHGYLKLVGGDYPVVQLAPKGEQALQKKLSIDLTLSPSISNEVKSNVKKHEEPESDVDTIEKTYELFQNGLSPEQIAIERKLADSTVYAHLAKLIKRGDVSVDDVISAIVRQQIENAIAQAGTEYITSVKELLPDEISYGQIRCVIEARLRERSMTTPKQETVVAGVQTSQQRPLKDGVAQKIYEFYEKLPGQNRAEFVHLMGEMQAESAMEMLTKALQDEDGNVRRLAASAIGKIGNYQAVPNLTSTIETTDSSSSSIENTIEAFLHTAHPQPLKGNWDEGFALDFHSRYQGHDNLKTELGQMVTDYKYHGHKEFVQPLAKKLIDFIREHPKYKNVDFLLAIPSTRKDRVYQPVDLLAQEVSKNLNIPYKSELLVRTRQTEQQKEMKNLEQKRSNIAGAFRMEPPEEIRNQRVLLLDDLVHSGETLKEATRTLKQTGASTVYVLVLTKAMTM
ncbi:RecQ family ATP-dependent DNA helicase [Candidatus Poribacteria bacterium]|nr:RecQ family ATP-dependent DNA helicase [Candidatus Poribacteria bacterium]